MIKRRLGIAVAASLLIIIMLGVAAAAQPEVPAPYAGLKNPFPWDDAGAQQAGKKVYQQSCLGCHGVKGDSLAASDFSKVSYADGLQGQPDLYFWMLSEGRLDKGMPPFKSSLSETQRWQVINYLWSLGKQAPAPEPSPSLKPSAEGATLQIIAPKDAQSGRPVSLAATLRNSEGKPIENAAVTFFLDATFFAKGLMEVGDSLTNKDGKATIDTVLPETGDVRLIARYQTVEAKTTLNLTATGRPFYRTEVGIRMPTVGQEVFIGPVVSEGMDTTGHAPQSALRLPGGALSWLLLPVMAVLVIWATYCYVMYQVLRISPSGRTSGVNTRFVPYTLLVALAVIGIILALKIATGPYSQINLLP